MSNLYIILFILPILFISPLKGADVELDKDGQGQGNKGTTFRPVDIYNNPADFEMKARSSIDDSQPANPNASGQQGTVYVDKKGTGVKTLSGGGSKGISGGGGDRDEELTFTYDTPVLLYSVTLGLNDIDFGSGLGNKDDPYIYLQLSTDAPNVFSVVIDESIIQDAFTSTGGNIGLVDFSEFIGHPSLPGLTGLTMINAFTIRETNDHLYVNSLTGGVPAPEPGTVLILSSCLMYVAMKRKKKF